MSTEKDGDRDNQGGVVVDRKTREATEHKVARPRLYKVLFHNDDFTTMEFVVAVLCHVFHHSETTATAIMLDIHKKGLGVAGVYTFEIAETKTSQTMEFAKEAEFPLQVTMEPEETDQ